MTLELHCEYFSSISVHRSWHTGLVNPPRWCAGNSPVVNVTSLTLGFSSGAGADTTAISMAAIVTYIGLNTDIYERLQTDIDAFYTANKLEALQPLTFTQIQQIPLVRAVVAESVRLVPAICGQLLRVSPGTTVGDYWIPPGCTIGLSAMAVNKEPSIFGDDAQQFRPDRWLESAEAFTRLDGASMTFGSGSRGCLGKNIALVCLSSIL